MTAATLTLPDGSEVKTRAARRWVVVSRWLTDDGSGVPHVATTADTRSRALSAWRRLNRSPWIEAWLIDAADGAVVRDPASPTVGGAG